MSDLHADLAWRGLIHQTTDPDRVPDWLASDRRTLYAGFDPTADSLHVGSLMPLLLLRRFQRAGHRPIALVGGATGMIGDPSGKNEERNLLNVDQVRHNERAIRQQLTRFLDFSGPGGAVMANNLDWLQDISYLDFLRQIGKNFPVNVMLAKDSVKGRLERPDGGMSYTEFSYMLLQAYDFVHLYRTYGCELQVGGSDQWGNITAGIDLARRMDGVQLYGITCPLLTKSDGTKMGKTEAGTVWLSPVRTSPYQFYQYWINVSDQDVGKCLRYLTDLDRDQIEQLDQLRQTAPEQRGSQRRLAAELTRLVHGLDALERAQRASDILFGAEICRVSDEELTEIFPDVPSKALPRDRLNPPGLSIVDALLEAGLVKSKGEARRLIMQGGAYINNRRRDSIDILLGESDLASESTLVLRSGRRNYALLRFIH